MNSKLLLFVILTTIANIEACHPNHENLHASTRRYSQPHALRRYFTQHVHEPKMHYGVGYFVFKHCNLSQATLKNMVIQLAKEHPVFQFLLNTHNMALFKAPMQMTDGTCYVQLKLKSGPHCSEVLDALHVKFLNDKDSKFITRKMCRATSLSS
ncbi:hypothetical protein L596_013476 [Steinernema carpocapsae]|uniref:Uncharacterized protein n=1 Tax=Steinernema carpocapsae TaxID=34508 RepID=A0A4U5P0S0_STECR|nr:hypothetical protein L596_013476 [Steinernema carpocapsae]